MMCVCAVCGECWPGVPSIYQMKRVRWELAGSGREDARASVSAKCAPRIRREFMVIVTEGVVKVVNVQALV